NGCATCATGQTVAANYDAANNWWVAVFSPTVCGLSKAWLQCFSAFSQLRIAVFESPTNCLPAAGGHNPPQAGDFVNVNPSSTCNPLNAFTQPSNPNNGHCGCTVNPYSYTVTFTL